VKQLRRTAARASVLTIGILLGAISPAYADDCSGVTDCFTTAAAASAAMGGLIGLLAALFALAAGGFFGSAEGGAAGGATGNAAPGSGDPPGTYIDKNPDGTFTKTYPDGTQEILPPLPPP
jgi:hypothetical protein